MSTESSSLVEIKPSQQQLVNINQAATPQILSLNKMQTDFINCGAI